MTEIRNENYHRMGDDRLRCQHCQGFYWRLWHDQAQCLACQYYTMIELGDNENPQQLMLSLAPYDVIPPTLLQVGWIREQLLEKEGVDCNKRVTDPVSGRTEFIIFHDRLRCRVSAMETLIWPHIQGYWLLGHRPTVYKKLITEAEALDIVRKNKEEQDGGLRATGTEQA
jgi:hypothetical protein